MSKVSLDDFISEIEEAIQKFEYQYKEKNLEDPDKWPLEMDQDNSGIWYEMFLDHLTEEIGKDW